MCLYRDKKTNKILFVLERILTLAVLAISMIVDDSTILILALIFLLLPIFGFKIYYVYVGIKQLSEQKKVHS